MNRQELSPLYKQESLGTYGSFELEIKAGASVLPDLNSASIQNATYDAAKLIQTAIMVEVIKKNPDAIRRAADEKAKILALFPSKPFVEEIPNGYCSDYCCKHLPWFIVTTQVGRIKIGWRKSVMAIDWSETHQTKNSHELFASEEVTKDERGIHAWSYEKAKEYIEAIINSAPPSKSFRN